MAKSATALMIRIGKYRPDTLDFLSRIEAAGGPVPDKATRMALNGLKRSLANASLTALPGHLHVVQDSIAATQLNILNTSYTGTNMGATLTSKKFVQGNGTSTYWLTGYNPSVAGAPLNAFSLGGAFQDNATSAASADMGCSDTVSSHGTLLNPRTASSQAATRINAQTTHNQAGVSNAAQSFTAVRTTSALYSLYVGTGFSTAFGGGGQTSTGVPNVDMAICAIGRSTVTTFSTRKFCAWWAFGQILTVFQAAALHRAVETYLSDIGART